MAEQGGRHKKQLLLNKKWKTKGDRRKEI